MSRLPVRTHAAARGLRRYVTLVADAVSADAHACTSDVDTTARAYIVIDDTIPRYPDRDVALLWNDEHGWSAAIETGCGEDTIMLAYLGHSLLPPPRIVAEFLADLLADCHPGQPTPPDLGENTDHDDLNHMLAAYAPPLPEPRR